MNNTTPNKPRSVVFANYKGGVTKTTLTVHFAVFLAKKLTNLNVLVLDMDDQRSSHGFFEGGQYIRNSWPLTQINQHPDTLPEDIGDKGIIDLVYMDDEAKHALDNNNDVLKTASFIRPLLSPLNYDYIVIDCPAGMNQKNYAGMLIGEYFVLPMGASREDYNGATETFVKLIEIVELVEAHNIELPDKSLLGYLPVRVSKGHLQTKMYLQLIKDQIGDDLIDTVMTSNRPVIQQAMKDKIAIWDYNIGDPRDARAEMAQVANILTNRIYAIEADDE